jgi:CIC family chloride channel protein
LKLFSVTISYASGNAGGIFGPSLFLGAMLGGIVGTVAHQFAPGYVATPGAYALVGMGTAFAGIVRAPMTSVLMIFEITRYYAVIVPLMISNLVSFFIASRFQREPIYEVLAQQDGIHLPTAAQELKKGNGRCIRQCTQRQKFWMHVHRFKTR